MLHHVGLFVKDVDKSKDFYLDLLEILDYRLLVSHGNWHGYGVCEPIFWVGAKGVCAPQHIVFSTAKKEVVELFHQRGLSLGASCNGLPKYRNDFYQDYYGAFLKDLERNSIGVIYQEHLNSGK